MRSRLTIFLALVLLILGLMEVFVRANGEYFYALSDRLLLKIKIFERSPADTRVLLIGTSRFLDAVDQGRLTQSLEEKTGDPTRAVNGATAGIGVGEMVQFAEVAAESETLTHVLLEASIPALQERKALLATGEEAPDEEEIGDRESRFAIRFENQLQEAVGDHLAMVEYRKALRPKSFLKLFVLYSANLIDPSVWSRKGLLRQLFTSSGETIEEATLAKWQPELIEVGKAEDGSAVPVAKSPEYAYLVKLSEVFEKSGIDVIWVMPPVTEVAAGSENLPQRREELAQIADRYGSKVWNYSQLKLDPTQYRDSSHLNAEGRSLFSQILARDLGEVMTREHDSGGGR